MKAILWSKYNCTNCDQAHALLRYKGYQIEERKIGDGFTKEELMLSLA
jgi:arsenate reductase-like glutaredoxin family protein